MKLAEEWIKEFEQHITHGGWCDMYEYWQEHNVPLVRKIQVDALRWAADLADTLVDTTGHELRQKAEKIEGAKSE